MWKLGRVSEGVVDGAVHWCLRGRLERWWREGLPEGMGLGGSIPQPPRRSVDISPDAGGVLLFLLISTSNSAGTMVLRYYRSFSPSVSSESYP